MFFCNATIEHVKLPCLLQPLLVPEHAWFTIRLDIVEGLPKYDGMHVISVVVDKVTKYAHFWPCPTPILLSKWPSCTLVKFIACINFPL